MEGAPCRTIIIVDCQWPANYQQLTSAMACFVASPPPTDFANFVFVYEVHKTALFHTKYLKNFPGWGTAPSPDPNPSAPTAPQLRAFSAASTPSASWSRRLGGLSPHPHTHSKNLGYAPALHAHHENATEDSVARMYSS